MFIVVNILACQHTCMHCNLMQQQIITENVKKITSIPLSALTLFGNKTGIWTTPPMILKSSLLMYLINSRKTVIKQLQDNKIITPHARTHARTHTHTHTHTHTFNGPLCRTTRVSRYQKGKTNLDFTEARDSEWQWHQLDHMQVCTSFQTDNHANTHHSVFYRSYALPVAQPAASKH